MMSVMPASDPLCHIPRKKAGAKIDMPMPRPYHRLAMHPPHRGRVLVFGSINTDLVVYVERLPVPGETVSGGTYASFPGGKGANQAVAAALAGAAVEMHGCLGDDPFGRERMASLEKTGVATRGIRVLASTASGIAQITVDGSGENTIAVAPGANRLFTADGIEMPRPGRGAVIVSLFQNEVPQDVTEELIHRAHEAGHIVIWNLAPTLTRPPSAETLAAVDYLVCNRNELAALAGTPVPEDRARAEETATRLISRGVRSLLVTFGSEGSVLVSRDGLIRIEAFPVEAIDTVGAGDCFCGVLAASLSRGMPTEQAMRRASAAAAISTTRRGAQTSMPTADEIEAFLRARGD
jgi:ribokinase